MVDMTLSEYWCYLPLKNISKKVLKFIEILWNFSYNHFILAALSNLLNPPNHSPL